MRIFYDGVIYSFGLGYGGVARYFLELVDKIANLDDASMFLFRFPSLLEKKENIILKESVRIPFGIPKIKRLIREVDKIRLPRIIRSFNPDLYHTTYYRIPQDVKAPKVITVYDMIHEKFLSSEKGSDVFLQRKAMCIKMADKIIAISENTKRDILEYIDIPEEKIAVTYLAASSLFREASDDEKSKLRRKYNLTRPFILYVGNRDRYKNFIILLHAYSRWNKNKEFDLVCVGGRQVFSKDEIEVIRNANIDDSVKLFTDVNDDELRSFYSSSYVFVYPSLYEGFGIPPLEAMACDTPVIASNVSSIPEVVGDAGMYFNPSSEEELLSCLNQIVDDAKLRKQLIEKGINRAKLFDWEKTAAETYNIYKALQKLNRYTLYKVL